MNKLIDFLLNKIAARYVIKWLTIAATFACAKGLMSEGHRETWISSNAELILGAIGIGLSHLWTWWHARKTAAPQPVPQTASEPTVNFTADPAVGMGNTDIPKKILPLLLACLLATVCSAADSEPVVAPPEVLPDAIKQSFAWVIQHGQIHEGAAVSFDGHVYQANSQCLFPLGNTNPEGVEWAAGIVNSVLVDGHGSFDTVGIGSAITFHNAPQFFKRFILITPFPRELQLGFHLTGRADSVFKWQGKFKDNAYLGASLGWRF